MLTVAQARAQLAAETPAPKETAVHVAQALGAVLAEDILADIDLPPFRRAMMDGYAVIAADTPGELQILEEIPAGKPPTRSVERGGCSKIMTGAPVPDGADAVIQVEKTEPLGRRVRVEGVRPGQSIQPAAEDVRAGEIVLRRGQLIRAQEIAALCTFGRMQVRIFRRPTCAVVATGSELVEPSARPAPAEIRNSNSYMLEAQVCAMGLACENLGIVRDDKAAIRSKVREALSRHDVLILSGGVSAGDYDYAIECLNAEGVSSVMHQILLKPGRPFFFGKRGEQRIFGLPGNPVSSFVTFELFVRPCLGGMMGWRSERRRTKAVLKTAIGKAIEREHYLPGRLHDGTVEPIFYHSSADILAVTRANCFVVIPANQTAPTGSTVDVMLLDDYNS